MAEGHEENEEPLHQAYWVFFVSVGACYAFLLLVLFAKAVSPAGDLGFGGIFEAMGFQAVLFLIFTVLFGVIFWIVRKTLVSPTSEPET